MHWTNAGCVGWTHLQKCSHFTIKFKPAYSLGKITKFNYKKNWKDKIWAKYFCKMQYRSKN